MIHVSHEGIVPSASEESRTRYDVQVIAESSEVANESSYSTALQKTTCMWGDICGTGPGGVCTGPADGRADVAQDVVGLLDKFANINALPKAMADLEPGDNGANNGPDLKVNISRDVLYALEAFSGFSYPFTPGDPCGPG